MPDVFTVFLNKDDDDDDDEGQKERTYTLDGLISGAGAYIRNNIFVSKGKGLYPVGLITWEL